MLQATDIAKRYGREGVLAGVSLHALRGQVTCIIGANGSGKSTLLSIVAGLLPADSGQVLCQGKPVHSRQNRKAVGFVPQQDSLFADLSVRDNLSFWAAAAGVSLSAALRRPAVERLDLEPLLRKRVKSLSGGMRRRVAVAVALLAEPSLLILDEPFAGLDLFYKQQLTAQLQQLRQGGVTILYTSHNADEIVPLSDTVYLLHRGKMALHAASGDLPADRDELGRYLLNLIGEEQKPA